MIMVSSREVQGWATGLSLAGCWGRSPGPCAWATLGLTAARHAVARLRAGLRRTVL
ncbi:hypothetical protein [Actinomyces weissii]|uniref:Uncharacterized protein n=1 Tax=Actinomyces weissii TaxID=675090 RepID=A0A7T7MA20_9ACTO|nr:hypothetical protein [Actinomyces weissii]QQM67683.1 hypothetical protein JG540_02025 [Actinomyces weissii]